MRITFSFVENELELAEYLGTQLLQAAAPVRFRARKAERDGRKYISLQVSEYCSIKPKGFDKGAEK